MVCVAVSHYSPRLLSLSESKAVSLPHWHPRRGPWLQKMVVEPLSLFIEPLEVG